jgi:undecaprenyl-diphosphatase
VCAATLTFGALLMIIAERVRATSRGDQDITPGEAFVIGIGQAAALVPGMSRSGTTISIAMLMGIRREAAARFTFLMSIPAVVAAAAREAVELRNVTLDASAITMFAVGVVVAGVVGYLSVKYLIRYLANNSLDIFAYYRFALAGAVVAWLVTRS